MLDNDYFSFIETITQESSLMNYILYLMKTSELYKTVCKNLNVILQDPFHLMKPAHTPPKTFPATCQTSPSAMTGSDVLPAFF